MDVNNMVAAMAARTVDAMVNVEPYNAIAEADGLATTLMDYWSVDKMPVFMAATPEFVAKSADTVVNYLKAWLDVARDFKDNPGKVADAIYGFYASKGYTMSQGHVPQGAGHRRRRSRLPVGSRRLHGPARRGAPEGEEDRRHPRLEQGAAPRLHGAGAVGNVTGARARCVETQWGGGGKSMHHCPTA